ncbi:helix-turn-helix domain-containing protein [Roseobacter sp. S98]|uniref:helix-turn-helix domain-containing protein n=1 Tax=Roseobacter algicola (ex Choi et al. 2025) (nom. illeg.) TaxID=3092138 RepID=UPI0035C6B5B8
MPRPIPNYDLYGNLLSGASRDAVHCERVRERSAPHDWTIRLHRHKHLAQFFLFETAGIEITLAETRYRTTRPSALFVPPGTPHGFRFPDNTEGDVLTLALEALDADTVSRISLLPDHGATLLTEDTCPFFDDLRSVTRQAQRVFADVRPARNETLCTLARLLVLLCQSSLQTGLAGARPVDVHELTLHEQQAQRFCNLLEHHFQEPLSVGEYASRTGVSPAHLTRICRRLLNASPNALVRQRRLVEARRLLEFTRHPVTEIAQRSGYRDPAFFCRTFKKQTGMTPGGFRMRVGS